MNKEEIKDCILRLLLVYPISPVNGYKLEDIDTYLSSLFPEFHNKPFTEGLEAILSGMVIVGYLETYEVTPGYVVLTEKKTVTFYKLAYAGRSKAEAIDNQAILYAIPGTMEKDLISLNHCLKCFTPYIKFSQGKLRNLIKECILKLPIQQQLRLYDRKMDDRFFNFILNNGFIEQIDAEQYEFNFRGRKLVDIGDYDSFVKRETEQAKKESDKKGLEYNLLKSQSEFQEINNAFVKNQTTLIESQLKTNEISKTTNTYIAIFTTVAGLYYIVQLAITLIPMEYKSKGFFIYLIFFLSLAASIFGWGWKERKKKQS